MECSVSMSSARLEAAVTLLWGEWKTMKGDTVGEQNYTNTSEHITLSHLAAAVLSLSLSLSISITIIHSCANEDIKRHLSPYGSSVKDTSVII